MSHPECEAMQNLIALDAGGDLDRGEEQRLERHLAWCPECRGFAEEMRHSLNAVRGLAGVSVGEDVLDGVRSAVRNEIEGRRRRPAPILGFPVRTLRAHRGWLAAAAAVLLTVGAGWWLASRRPAPSPSPLPRVVRYEPPPREASPTEPPFVAESETVDHAVEPRVAAVEPPVREIRRAPPAVAETTQPASQPMVVKWLVDDPDLVIYWLIETEETTQETT